MTVVAATMVVLVMMVVVVMMDGGSGDDGGCGDGGSGDGGSGDGGSGDDFSDGGVGFVNNKHRLSSKARATIDKFREEAVGSTFTNPFSLNFTVLMQLQNKLNHNQLNKNL